MYNLNDKKNLLTVESCTITPGTPEIVAELANIWFPADSALSTSSSSSASSATSSASTTNVNNALAAIGQRLNQCDSHSSCSGSPLDSPGGSSAQPSIEQNRSELVKATLKHSLQMKRKNSCGDSSESDNLKMTKREYDSSEADDDDADDTDSKSVRCDLTPKDEENRRRRRERNKVAATKCRLKKRERTNNLIKESEVLDSDNIRLKAQVRQLDQERRKLLEGLQQHSCSRPAGLKLPQLPVSALKVISDLAGSQGCDSNAIPSVHTIGRFSQNASASSSSTANSPTTTTAKSGKTTRGRAAQTRNNSKTISLAQIAINRQQLSNQHNGTSNTATSTSASACSAAPHHNAMTMSMLPQMAQHATGDSHLDLELFTPRSGTNTPIGSDAHHHLLHSTPATTPTSTSLHIADDLGSRTGAHDLLLPANYCKASPNDYAPSPDSGFVKSPTIDSFGGGGYACVTPPTSNAGLAALLADPNSNGSTNHALIGAGSSTTFLHQLQQPPHGHKSGLDDDDDAVALLSAMQHTMKSDYIPSPACLLDAVQFGSPLHANPMHQLLVQQQHQQQHHQQPHDQPHHQQNGDLSHLIGPGDGSEYSLKIEQAEGGVHSPYTTEQSADRFLYDGDSSPLFADSSVLEQTELKMLLVGDLSQHHQQLPANQQQLLSNNNNTLHATMNGMQSHPQHQQQPHQMHAHQQQPHQQQHMNNIDFISTHHGVAASSSAMFDVLKSDYHQHSDFLSLADANAIIGSDAHFTDMDSGITTYAAFMNNTTAGGTGNSGSNNGCMA